MNGLTTADTFGPTINSLKTTLQDFGPLVTPIDRLTNVVTDIDDLLICIDDVISAANDIDNIILVLGDVLDFLDPIPIVGEIAGAISATVETVGGTLKDALTAAHRIDEETIQPVAKTLGKIKTGLADVRNVVVDISQKVPGYLNTIEILHYLSEIAEPMTKVLKGTESADELNKLLATFNQVQQDLGKALNELNPVITAADTGVKDLTKVLDEMQKAMGNDATAVLDGIKSAATALTPLSNGFHRMEDAIKPLAWVLDAISYIVDKILTPVINLILHATHLDTLIKTAEDDIFKKLGISPLMDMSTKNISGSDVSKASGSTGPSQGEDANRLWNAAETALSQYRTSKDGGTKAAILGLVSAITNTPIDPNKPSKAPPFRPPSTPTINPATTGDKGGSTVQAFFVPRKITHIAADVVTRLKQPPVRVHSRSSLALAAMSDTPAPPPLPEVDPKDWPKSAALIDSIGALTTNLDALAPAAAKLEGTLTQFEASLSLPTTFAQQVADMSALLTDMVNILDFFESLNIGFLTELVKPFDDVAHDQNNKMGAVNRELPALITAMSKLEAASKLVITTVPQTEVIDQTIHRVEGWSMSVNQTVQFVREIRAKDAAQGSKQKAQIDAFAQKVEEVSNAVVNKVEKIATEVKTLSTAIGALQYGLDTYTSEITVISKHSTLISTKALPVADQALHILGIVNSVIDPLSGLLQAENCVDATKPWKVYAAAAKTAINDVGKAAATAQPEAFTEFAEKLAEKVLPLTELSVAVKSASLSISTNTVSAFVNQSGNLVTGLTNLGKELVETQSYTTTIKTRQGGSKTITVNNDLFSQDLLEEANKILISLGIKTSSS